jgi:transcriptional regulator with XRE-family HTH domain
MKVKNCTTFLKERRKLLGLDQQAVASAVGVSWETYRQWEHRGQIPEEHLPQIAATLRVSVLDLLIAKWKPVIEHAFAIEADTIELFLRKHSKI